MATVEPAVAHIQCPDCDEIIDILIPVSVTFVPNGGGQTIYAEVRAEDWSSQRVWDHALAKHGPVV